MALFLCCYDVYEVMTLCLKTNFFALHAHTHARAHTHTIIPEPEHT